MTRFQACPNCGAEVVYEYGKLDGVAYRNGVVQFHVCSLVGIEIAPLNERDFNEASDVQLETWGTARIPEPVKPAPKPQPLRKPAPGQRGGV